MASASHNFIFWCPVSVGEEEEEIGFEDEMPEVDNSDGLAEGLSDEKEKGKGKTRESMYVSLVEGMVKTVLESESFLFSEEELAFFTSYKALSYKARYLLARLLVRKTGKWYRHDQLKYVSELGADGILAAMKELCASLSASGSHNQLSPPIHQPLDLLMKHSNVIDLTLDEEDDLSQKCSSPSRTFRITNLSSSSSDDRSCLKSPGAGRGAFDFFAEDDSAATLSELLKCLTVDELRSLARTMKLPNTPTTRAALIDALLASASAQTTLGNFASTSLNQKSSGRDAKNVRLRQACLSFTPVKKVQTDVLRTLVLKILKKCIRVNDTINALFHRLHIIYFRSTEHPTSLLTPALLRRCRKRYYPLYTYVRTPEIFTSREALVAYEDALRMEAAVDMMLENSIDVEVAQAHIDSWAKGREKTGYDASFPPPHTLRSRYETPVDLHDTCADKENASAPQTESNTPAPATRGCSYSAAEAIDLDADDQPKPVKESQAAVNARYVVEVFERVYPRWKELVRQRGELAARPHGLERFDEGYILTRIVYKGAAAFGKLKNFEREIQLLQELLAQRRWRRGKRGAWYDRCALILMHHLARAKKDIDGEVQLLSKEQQRAILKKAMEVIVEGLHDDDTHIVYRQALSHRLSRLEKRLNVPVKKCHECTGRLHKAVEVKFFGERVRKRSNDVASDKTGKVVNKALVPVFIQIQGQEAVAKHLCQLKKERKKIDREQWKGKSLWYGKSGEEINVETLALHHYELQGFKGFHSEASIVCTIWGLLFWDILFSSVPGAFETPYQSAPLDIATECFYFARKEAIEERLEEITEGKAPEILAKVDDEYRKNNTMCVGVRWNDFSKQDLVEIVTCLGGDGLSVICRLLCEDYGGRHSGVPDLIIWRMEDKVAKFVEVKGPGDNLSENQKVWIDVLLQAGVGIEVCRIAEKENPEKHSRRQIPKKSKVIRMYRVSDGKELPIDADEAVVESGEELHDISTPSQGPQIYEPPQKRRRITEADDEIIL